jgi:hypothetical protein
MLVLFLVKEDFVKAFVDLNFQICTFFLDAIGSILQGLNLLVEGFLGGNIFGL